MRAQRIQHQLLVIATDDKVEPRRRVVALDSGLRLEAVGAGVDRVAEQ